jgi:uncharacterized protein DUF3800
MAGIIPHQDFAFFVDESGVSQGRYLAVGGICVRRDTILGIHADIERFRKRHNMHAELKWTKISNQKQSEYEALVDYFFFLKDKNLVHFHSVIFDSHKWKNKIYNDGDQDVGISKLFYQLIHHKYCGSCGRHGSLFVCLDHRNSSTSLEDLRRMVNSAALRDHKIRGGPIKKIVSADSKEEDLLQINDVILGAVNAVRNEKHLLDTTRRSKREIAKRVLLRSGLARFDQCSPRGANRFTVWNFRAR